MLPASLLALLSVSLSASSTWALPTIESHSPQLTPSDFTPELLNGTWLVEFFSPYCGHCRHFAPTWEQLYERVITNGDDESHDNVRTEGIKMGQVNCISEGDLCNAQGIRGYPTLLLYKDAVKGLEYPGQRTYDDILHFISANAPPLQSPAQPPSSHESANSPTAAADDAITSETTTSTPSLVVQSRSSVDPNPHGSVLALTTNTFTSALSAGPVFVKFFAPWCGHCKKLAPIWSELASNLAHKLSIAEINCDDNPSVCKKQGVNAYPALYYYKEGYKLEYLGKRNLDSLEAFIDKVTAPSVTEVESALALSKASQENDVIFLFIHSDEDKEQLDLIHRVGNTLLLTPPFQILTTTQSQIRSAYLTAEEDYPVLLVFKKSVTSSSAASKPISALAIHPSTSAAQVSTFVEKNRFPLISELTSENFQSIMQARFDPLIVLMITGTEPRNAQEGQKILANAESQYRLRLEQHKLRSKREVLWVHLEASSRWSSWLKGMYGVKGERMIPSVIISDHSKLLYYSTNKDGEPIEVSASAISFAVEEAVDGKLTARNSENFLERLARKLNNASSYIGDAFVAHPFRSSLIVVALFIFLIYAVVKIVSEDIGSGSGYRPDSPIKLTGKARAKRRLD
ncbi:thioredoxin-domain-containing protein [Sistotremastrum suecicum HHB10207 ss-3]|uniref:Thioredoxin-domain-containing protein n=1 Tax=Sistotremastrum suecicum HHB10207 ss-3 TaxID=1314776 RepID=A0A165YED1_9AGAM|nr:thioredoxin-domain-containing protein [Sistotremastrum suecicum HHB10207 ss-3]